MFRIGTTSYIYPADISTNVKKLSGKVSDIELVLFEFDGESNVPDHRVLEELIEARNRYRMSYTIHLPLDLALAGNRPNLDKAIRVIDLTRCLSPAGYVVHLDGCYQLDESMRLANSMASLTALTHAVEDSGLLCVENLESHTPEFIDRVLEAIHVSACIDIGHLWKRGEDPVPVIAKRLERTRIVHLHGLQGRDHRSLSFVAPADLDPVMEFLLLNYTGILTIEVFSETDLNGSLDVLRSSAERVSRRHSLEQDFTF